MDNSYFPMFVDISHWKILVAGGGVIATRRVKTLLKFQAQITVVAPKVTEELQLLAKEKQIKLLQKQYEEQDLDQADLVLAATDQKVVNQQILKDCRRRNEKENRKILVNTADDKAACDFYFPAVVKEDEIVIGINSGGKDPKKTHRVRGKIEKILKEETI